MTELNLSNQLLPLKLDNATLAKAQDNIEKLDLTLAEYLNLVLTHVPNNRTQLKHILAEIGSEPANQALATWLNQIDVD